MHLLRAGLAQMSLDFFRSEWFSPRWVEDDYIVLFKVKVTVKVKSFIERTLQYLLSSTV